MTAQQPHSPVTDGFRTAMRRMASSVSVITTRTGDTHQGIAASSVTSLSMQPPSLLVCINRALSMHAALHESGLFCVNLLGEEHGAVCDAFGGKLSGAERFSVGNWLESENGLRHLAGSPAAILCRLDGTYDYGSHTICVGVVEQVLLAGDGAPLLYREGGIGRFVAAPK